MEARTWPDPAVGSLLAAHYRGVKFDLARPHDDFAEGTSTVKVVWAPTFVVDDVRGRELSRWTGWLPPEEFVAELKLPLAMDHLHHKRIDAGIPILAGILADTPDAPAAAEALHFLGIFEFLAGKRDMDALRSRWNELRERFPESRFARHSEVIDDVPV